MATPINIRHISSHKMILVGLEPQWYITQRVILTTSHSTAYKNPTCRHSTA